MKTYKDVYHFPLHNSEIGWVRDAKSQFVFQFEDYVHNNILLQNNIVDTINGNYKPKKQHHFVHEDGLITEDGNEFILIRGWGNLTGTGGHNLSPEEAANIQDTFAEFIVKQLNQSPEL
jgi:hypothetical protein